MVSKKWGENTFPLFCFWDFYAKSGNIPKSSGVFCHNYQQNEKMQRKLLTQSYLNGIIYKDIKRMKRKKYYFNFRKISRKVDSNHGKFNSSSGRVRP